MLELPRDIGVEGAAPSVPPFKEMLAEYYTLRQWDAETGAISREVLTRLGLPEPILAERQPVAVA
jgi:aldehyde:ferredoxin oxidoreductase